MANIWKQTPSINNRDESVVVYSQKPTEGVKQNLWGMEPDASTANMKQYLGNSDLGYSQIIETVVWRGRLTCLK